MTKLNDTYQSLNNDFEKLKYLADYCGVEITSYGHMVNPFCYAYNIEFVDQYRSAPQVYKDELSLMCSIAKEGYLAWDADDLTTKKGVKNERIM